MEDCFWIIVCETKWYSFRFRSLLQMWGRCCRKSQFWLVSGFLLLNWWGVSHVGIPPFSFSAKYLCLLVNVAFSFLMVWGRGGTFPNPQSISREMTPDCAHCGHIRMFWLVARAQTPPNHWWLLAPSLSPWNSRLRKLSSGSYGFRIKRATPEWISNKCKRENGAISEAYMSTELYKVRDQESHSTMNCLLTLLGKKPRFPVLENRDLPDSKFAISFPHALKGKYMHQWKCVWSSLYFWFTANVHPGTISSLSLGVQKWFSQISQSLGSPAGNHPAELDCHSRIYSPVCLLPPLCELTWVVTLIWKTSLSPLLDPDIPTWEKKFFLLLNILLHQLFFSP